MDVRQLVARAPLRTVRTSALGAVYANPHKEARELVKRGILHRLAHGFYCAVPAEHDPTTWSPTIEGAAAGIAAAAYGDRIPVLMGLSAARLHHALPRAIGEAYVAVPTAHRPLPLTDRGGTVHFALRDVAALDAELLVTDLGPALATTKEQTVLDLARLDPRGTDLDTRQAIDAMWAGCDQDVIERLAGRQRMRATLRRLRGIYR